MSRFTRNRKKRIEKQIHSKKCINNFYDNVINRLNRMREYAEAHPEAPMEEVLRYKSDKE